MIGKELEAALQTQKAAAESHEKADAALVLARGKQCLADLLVIEQLLERLALEHDTPLGIALYEIIGERKRQERLVRRLEANE